MKWLSLIFGILILAEMGCSGATIGGDDLESKASEDASMSEDASIPSISEDASLEDVRRGDTLQEDRLWASLVINEVAAAGEPEDWFELFNASDRPIDLTGYHFTDEIEARPRRGAFPDGTVILPGGYAVFYLNDEWPGFKFSNDEELGIFSPTGELIDAIDWETGDSPVGMSYGRIPDGIGPFQTLETPTPGAMNIEGVQNEESRCGNGRIDGEEVCDGADLAGEDCRALGFSDGELACQNDCQAYDLTGCVEAAGEVVINEVTSSGDDEIELYNPGAGTIDLTGWYLTDNEPEREGHIYWFEQGTTLEPKGFLVLVKGVHHFFGIGRTDHVALHSPQGDLVDFIAWSDGEAEVSLCRIPDGTGAFQSCSKQTFGTPNAE